MQVGQDRILDAVDFEEALTHHVTGDVLHLVVHRDDRSRTLDVTLGLPLGTAQDLVTKAPAARPSVAKVPVAKGPSRFQN